MDFFEHIGKRLSDAGQNVAQQTKNLADVAQLNNAVMSKEKKISQLFSEIGQSYYERHKNDEAAEEWDKISAIRNLYSEITVDKERIKQIKGVVKCVNCGADLPLDSAFCSVCGTRVSLPEVSKQENENMRFCPSCHAAMGKDDLFCSSCGMKIESENK